MRATKIKAILTTIQIKTNWRTVNMMLECNLEQKQPIKHAEDGPDLNIASKTKFPILPQMINKECRDCVLVRVSRLSSHTGGTKTCAGGCNKNIYTKFYIYSAFST